MASIWKDDKRPNENTLEKEIDRLERVVLALHIAVAERRTKHYERDFIEIGYCLAELRRLIKELGE